MPSAVRRVLAASSLVTVVVAAASCSSPESADRAPSFADTTRVPVEDAPAGDALADAPAGDAPAPDTAMDAASDAAPFEPDPYTPWIDEPFPGDDPPAEGPPVPVEVVRDGDAWHILRGGEPYDLRGAGFITDLDALAAAGANTIRTWGVGSDARALLDAAHARGMTVQMGLWLGHVSDGFNYEDPAQVAAQLERVRASVLELRDHPALLFWGVGNEMELGNDDPAMWRAVGEVAALVEELDPLHPTVIVTAEIGAANEARIAEYVPTIDVWGINAYQGLPSLSDRLRERGWEGPWIATEFGGAGGWEVATTDWGAPHEPTSTDKAASYVAGFDAIDADPACLGGFAFVWARADAPVDTWYTLLGPAGTVHEPIDGIIERWTGAPVPDRSPTVRAFEAPFDGAHVAPGEALSVTLDAIDPEGGALTYEWVVHRDSLDHGSGAGATASCSTPGDDATFAFDAPLTPGPYRVLGVARDPSGRAAFASARFHVDGEAAAGEPLPLRVDSRFAFSGWMGDASSGHVDHSDCHVGDTYCRGVCHAFAQRRGPESWAGVIWQHPAGNWDGSDDGLAIAQGATAVEFVAWGKYGGETVDFFVGGDVDGFEAKLEGVVLTSEPTTYRIPLRRARYDRVINGFGWVSGPAPGDEVKRFYVADVTWVAD